MHGMIQKTVAGVLLAIAVACIATGAVYSRKVYEQDEMGQEFGLITFERIPDWQLTIDATFTGVVRKDGKLYSTYDRSAPRGKRSCPT